MGTLDQRVQPGAAIGRVGMRVEMVEVVFRFLEDLIAGTLKQRLIEVTIAHFAREIADRRINLMGNGDDAIEERPEGTAGGWSGSLGVAQTPLENVENRGDLPCHPLVRLANPEQGLFQPGGSIEFADAVVRQSAEERFDKSRRKAFRVGLDHAQIGEQVRLGAGLFPRSTMVDIRFAMKQRTDVHKNPENLVLVLGDVVPVRRTGLAPGCELASGS